MKDIFHTDGSIAVHAVVFNDQEKLENEAAVQKLPSNESVEETDERGIS